MGDGSTVTLAAGRLKLSLSPSIGGAISAFEWVEHETSVPILRKCHTLPKKALDAASFPLVPYVNRIRDGRFTFRGRQVQLAPNMAGDTSPLHGQGWLNPWTLKETSDHRAVLTFNHHPGEWPWSYEARQEFSINEDGVFVALSCTNTDTEPMPCGLGQHPYFPCGSRTEIDTQVTHVWTIDEKVLPVEQVPAEGRYDLKHRLVCGQDLDNGFGGWGGRAHIDDPDWPFGVKVSSPTARFFQLYSPPQGGIFVAEPVTHANAALNAPENRWADLGMRVLESGEEMSLVMHLKLVSK